MNSDSLIVVIAFISWYTLIHSQKKHQGITVLGIVFLAQLLSMSIFLWCLEQADRTGERPLIYKEEAEIKYWEFHSLSKPQSTPPVILLLQEVHIF